MKRRRFVAAACATVGGLSGCVGDLDPGQRGESTTRQPSSRPLDEYGCPPFDPGAEGVVCSHTVDAETAPVSLRPSDQRADASTTDSLELTLHNESAAELEFNPHSWMVLREQGFGTEGEWASLDRRSQGDGRLVLAPGETHTWTVSEVVDTIDETATLGPGTYLASISVPDPDGADWLDCVALFRLV